MPAATTHANAAFAAEASNMAQAVVDRLLEAAFKYGDPRSPQYQLGARAALERRLMGKQFRCPYKMGAAQADAWFAGVDRGNAIWVRHVEQDSAA